MSKKQGKGVKQDEEFEEFVSSAIRAPRQGVYEHLLSQFLASAAIVSDPLKRIKIVTEAAMMVPEEGREDLAINYETVTVLNTVCIALQNVVIQKDYWVRGVVAFELAMIPWGFEPTKENYEKYIAPWFQSKYLIDVPPLMTLDYKKYKEKGEPISAWEWAWFFDATNCLMVQGYESLKNEFVSYAIPRVQLMLTELTHIVDPGLYTSILGLYTKRASYAEKVSEATRATTRKEDELEGL